MADNKFHCIILKGGDQYPYFPRPLLSEFDFSIPLTSTPPKGKKGHGENGDAGARRGDGEQEDEEDDNDDVNGDDGEENETRGLEQSFMLKGIQAAQLADLVDSTTASFEHRATLSRLELEIDKTLLQLLAVECREGEERGMRALELVELMRDRTGRMMEAAGKIAERYGRTILGEKIRAVGERRAGGMDED